MIEIKNLNKEYTEEESSTRALRGVTFSIEKGEFVSVMGPSGSGKSTLLHILSFLDRPTGGSYRFQGKSIDDMTDKELARVRNSDMGFVFQSFNLLSRLTVYENVEIPLLYSDIPSTEHRIRIEEAVQSVGLPEKLHTETGRLSGGQKQRVAIARALVTNPNVIFADEPTGNLDPINKWDIIKLLEKINGLGTTIVLATHDKEVIDSLQRRVVTLDKGKVVRDEQRGKYVL